MNPLVSMNAKIVNVEVLTDAEKLFTVRFIDEELNKKFDFKPGQFVIVDLRGFGEFPISICSPPTRKGFIQLCIRRAGRLTEYMHTLKEGDTIGIRGPYGNGFPLEKMVGSNFILVAGGLGMAPLRSVLWYLLDTRKYKQITLLYGCKRFRDTLFREEIMHLLSHGENLNCTIKLAYEHVDENVQSLVSAYPNRVREGLVTKLFDGVEFAPEETYALICGPPVMYKFVVKELLKRGLSPGRIYMTLERRMKCGIGKCGHCVVGTSTSIKYVCKDGPVFTYWDALSTRGLI